jgi:hypothetical protein
MRSSIPRRRGAWYSRTMPWHRLEDSNEVDTDHRHKRRFVIPRVPTPLALFFGFAGIVALWFLGYLLAGSLLH